MKKSTLENRIGIMSVLHEGRWPFGMQTYFFEDMVKSSNISENELFFFSPMDWSESIYVVRGYNFVEGKWVETSNTIPHIIYDRAFSKDQAQKLYIEQVRSFLNDSDRQILNPLGLADLLNNKTDFHGFMQRYSIPTLLTFPYNAIEDSQFFEILDTTKIYVKPTFGSKGEGIFVIEMQEKRILLFDQFGRKEYFEFYHQLLARLADLIDNTDLYFVQEAAKTVQVESAPFDIRVLVQNYGDDYVVTGKAVRVGQPNATTSNLNSGGNAMPLEELTEFFERNYMYSIAELHLTLEKLCLDCADVLKNEIGDFCEIGFDILITKDKGPIILEGNAKPSRWVFVKMADYLESIGKDNSYYLDRRRETVSVPMKYASYLLQKTNK